MNSKKSGFSILETLVALTLMILILGFLTFRTAGVGEQRKIEMVRGDLRAIQTAIHAYYLNHNKTYPSGADWQNNDLATDNPRILRQNLYDPFRIPAGYSGGCQGSVSPALLAAYEYSYFLSSDGKYYVVFSYGPDRAADIKGINTSGKLAGVQDDDIYMTNGTGKF